MTQFDSRLKTFGANTAVTQVLVNAAAVCAVLAVVFPAVPSVESVYVEDFIGTCRVIEDIAGV